MNGKIEALLEDRHEFTHLFRLSAFGSAHAKWQTNNEFHYAITEDNLLQRGQVGAFILTANRDQTLRRVPERVRNGKTDRSGTHIERHNAPGR
jgi:hypothetical protein